MDRTTEGESTPAASPAKPMTVEQVQRELLGMMTDLYEISKTIIERQDAQEKQVAALRRTRSRRSAAVAQPVLQELIR